MNQLMVSKQRSGIVREVQMMIPLMKTKRFVERERCQIRCLEVCLYLGSHIVNT